MKKTSFIGFEKIYALTFRQKTTRDRSLGHCVTETVPVGLQLARIK